MVRFCGSPRYSALQRFAGMLKPASIVESVPKFAHRTFRSTSWCRSDPRSAPLAWRALRRARHRMRCSSPWCRERHLLLRKGGGDAPFVRQPLPLFLRASSSLWSSLQRRQVTGVPTYRVKCISISSLMRMTRLIQACEGGYRNDAELQMAANVSGCTKLKREGNCVLLEVFETTSA